MLGRVDINKRGVRIAICLADHEGMVGRNPPSLKHVGFAPLKTKATYVDVSIVVFELIVGRARVAVLNEKNLESFEVSP